MIKKKINDKCDLILSFDDYHEKNMVIAEALLKYNFPATFFIETFKREAREQIKDLHKLGFKIGCHTWTHPADLKALSGEACKSELQISKKHIEDITGEECDVLAYPRGKFNDSVIEVAKSLGFKEARMTHVLHTKYEEDPFRIKTTVHMFDRRKEYADRPWYQIAQFFFDDAKRRGDFFHLWGHADEIDRLGYWASFKNILKFINENISCE